jgi:hypothetical protein
MKAPISQTAAKLVLAVTILTAAAVNASAQQNKPNILVLWGDDIGGFNISAMRAAAGARGSFMMPASVRTAVAV